MINVDEGKVYVKDQPVSLTALEYRLLLIFAQNQSIHLKRERILEHIWDISGNFVEDNTLTIYVKRLCEKLGDTVNITTVSGINSRCSRKNTTGSPPQHKKGSPAYGMACYRSP